MGTTKRSMRPRRNSEPLPAAVAPVGGEFTEDDRTAAWRDFIFKLAIIVLAGFWIYAPVYHGDWLWDDDQSITQNAVTQGPWSFRDIWVAPPGADYFPLTATGFWVPWQFYGPRPGMTPAQVEQAMFNLRTAYHMLNIVLHVCGALALWRLLHVMRLPGAWLGGLVFAIHPVCVESVAWMSELKNTLSQPLFLLACASFVQFDEEENAEPAALHYAAAVLFFLFAMFAKTAVVMFPFVVLAYGWWKHGWSFNFRGVALLLLAGVSLALTAVPEMVWLVKLRAGESSWGLWMTCGGIALLGPLTSILVLALSLSSPGSEEGPDGGLQRSTLERSVLYALPFFWISVILGLATCYFQWTRAIGQEAIPVGGFASRFATAGMAIFHYLWKTIWPFNLMTIYPKWDVDPPKVWQFLPWPVLVAAAGWLLANRGTAERPTWQRHMLFVLAFFLLMLLPILGFITISYMRITWVADHFLYTPMVSVLGFGAAGLGLWYARAKPFERPAALALGAFALALLALSSFRYAYVWANEESQWPQTIAGHPDPCREGCGCWQAHNRLGARKFARNDIEAAHYHFQNSTRLRPNLGETHNNLGTTHSARSQAAAQRGDEAAAKREMDQAIAQFREANRVTPNIPAIQVNLANSLAAAGRFVDAAAEYEALLEKAPREAALWNNYGVVLFKIGDAARAASAFRKALEINPNLKDARESLAVATGEKQPSPPGPQPGTPAAQLQLEVPASPTLGPSPLLQR